METEAAAVAMETDPTAGDTGRGFLVRDPCEEDHHHHPLLECVQRRSPLPADARAASPVEGSVEGSLAGSLAHPPRIHVPIDTGQSSSSSIGIGIGSISISRGRRLVGMTPEDEATGSLLGHGTDRERTSPNTNNSGSSNSNSSSSDHHHQQHHHMNSSNNKCFTCLAEFPSPDAMLAHECMSGLRVGVGMGEASSDERVLHSQATTLREDNFLDDDSVESTLSDVENFDGKIVYNPDGSAYIIEADESDLSDDEMSLDVPQQEGSIVDGRGMPSEYRSFPQIVNAFHVSRNPALYSAIYGQAFASIMQDKKKVPEAPIMHSYRVYNVRDKSSDKSMRVDGNDDGNASDSEADHCNKLSSLSSAAAADGSSSSAKMADYSSVPVKPILMCFICKLSFGYAKSFIAHVLTEHGMRLNEEEKDILAQKNTSAILQGVGRDKEPLVSFLEPVPLPSSQSKGQCMGHQSVYSSCASSLVTTEPVITSSGAVVTPTRSDSHWMTITSTDCHSNSNNNIISSSNIGNISSIGSSKMCGTSSSSSGVGVGLGIGVMAQERERCWRESMNLVIKQDNNKCDLMAKDNSNNKVLSECVRSDADHVPEKSSVSLLVPQHTSCSSSSVDFRKSPVNPLDRPESTTLLDRCSSVSPVAASVSPGSAQLFPPSSHSPSVPISVVGICSEHPNGKTNGVECPKCDTVLGSSRSLGGHMTMMHSRNSCKTLKCPKCNWHYKYQETLEIHMKEKHPENETTCIYCITNQPHPRLARGETYTCGYKPYRCDVCNYSTTTKGNLSIHMQSDKHLNNMQELQNGGVAPENSPQPQGLNTQSPVNQKPKPKPTWRCDVCNYETNVARNLRIHMTSEKHTHNMMVLQQNVKHMQQLSALQAQTLDPTLLHFHPGLTLPGDKPPPHTEAALADMAYSQALLIQMMTGNQLAGGQQMHNAPEPPQLDLGLPSESPMDMEPPVDGHNLDPNKLFACCVCNVYQSDSVEALNQHLQQDRTKQREHEILMMVSGNYICKLCSYKTNLKANFQLHCKTDKHLQRLQHVNHIKEGGLRNEWRLKYLNVSNPVQVKCSACDYYTNSTHKLQLHVATSKHESSSRLFRHLQFAELAVISELKYYHCSICNFSTRTKVNLIQHVRTMKHLRNESLRQMQRKNQQGGSDVDDDFTDIYSVREYNEGDVIQFDVDIEAKEEEATDEQVEDEHAMADHASMLKQALLEPGKMTPGPEQQQQQQQSPDQVHMCPYCNYCNSNEMRIQAHVLSQHTQRPQEILCPLCQEDFKEKSKLEKHLIQVHNVTPEGLQRLLLLVDQSQWLMMAPPLTTQSPVGGHSEDSDDSKGDVSEGESRMEDDKLSDGGSEEEYRCQMCTKSFRNIDDLCLHQNEFGHLELKQTPRGPGYLCWKKGCNQYFKTAQSLQIHFREIHAKKQQLAVSERHVYKYRCNQCSLAFKTMEKLQLHSQYHLIRAATKCVLCGRSFRSITALQKHVESYHSDLSESELEQYRASLMNNPLLLAGQGLDGPSVDMLKKENKSEDAMDEDGMDIDNNQLDESGLGTSADGELNEGFLGDGMYKEQQFFEDYLNSQAVAEDSYSDPTRKYKCHRCKVAFTRQSYLTSHNKTLLHRKGEKLSYPMEKYLDPNRPYKCDVCKESFTQKNILLVHYNSVSHLHKLKRSIQEQQNSQNSTVSNSSSGDSDKKPYKCNICKVAYSQGSTLDIHMRSVLHQTRASKLQELALTGQVDLTQPLIEQPEPQKIQDQHKRILAEMLNSKPVSQGQPSVAGAVSIPQLQSQVPQVQLPGQPQPSAAQGSPQLPMTSSSSQQTSPLTPPIAQPPVLLPSQISPQSMYTCQRCGSVFMTQETLLQHQQLYCFFQPPVPIIPPVSSASQSLLSSPLHQQQLQQQMQQQFQHHQTQQLMLPQTSTANSLNQQQQQLGMARFTMPRNKSSAVYKSLLESYGFELVMQFNEYHQRRPRRDESDKKANNSNNSNNNNNNNNNNTNNNTNNNNNNDNAGKNGPDGVTNGETSASASAGFHPKKEVEKESKSENLPEIAKSVCPVCSKEFSSIWVLKAHREEIHKTIVPLNVVMKFSEEFKSDYDKRNLSSTQATTPESTPASEPSSSPAEMIPAEMKFQIPMSTQSIPVTMAEITAMAASQIPQMQFNPMMMGMGLGMGLPLGMNMPALAAMNLHPPLIPIMMPPPLDPLAAAAAAAQPLLPPALDHNFLVSQQKLLQQQQAMQAHQQKRARTRINDEQLKILRAHFDINNSPTEEQIMEMAEKSGLPQKVIKHWFRNTLFKERQRNKDSPYNFNNPPSTALNLEEYEKTGEAKVTPLQQIEKKDSEMSVVDSGIGSIGVSSSGSGRTCGSGKKAESHQVNESTMEYGHRERSPPNLIKEERQERESAATPCTSEGPSLASSVTSTSSVFSMSSSPFLNALPSSSSGASLISSLASTITSENSLQACNPTFSSMVTPPTTPSISLPNSVPTTPTSSSHVNALSMGNGSSSSKHDGSTGKRANRTRFTDYQIKVLQEFFENNAYPKDDDLEYLSKLLNLSPRVIVVWFQNARQKARKVYENQPPLDPEEEGSGRFQRTPGLNYQCKKCLLVFQRYYELIKHQKSHCFKEDDALRNQSSITPEDNNSRSSIADSNQGTDTTTTTTDQSKDGAFRCDKCNLVFPRFDLWREHQIVHIMNPNLFPNYPPDTPFGILQYEAQQSHQQASPPKRKLSEDGDDDKDEQPRDKRLRTTILPEQLDYLYQKYQVESNPSRKMLENIAREVGLKKRVVQVWFQNTRARERKGQFRAHQQVINKRCPFCPALFKVKSALESHLATKHAEQYTKGEINIDNLPDEEPSNTPDNCSQPGSSGDAKSTFGILPISAAHMMPPLFSPATDVQDTMKKYYEDSLKKYLNELSAPGHRMKSDVGPTDLSTKSKTTSSCSSSSSSSSSSTVANAATGKFSENADTPLDLSKPVKIMFDSDKGFDGPLTDLSEKSNEDQLLCRQFFGEDAFSETHSESTDNMDGEDESNPTSPASSTHSQRPHLCSGKRFRTQMTTMQLKVMKTLFADYKTPTMAECEMLGREIGLPKRVVQVWFQNARAKEKKNKLALAKAFGQEVEFVRPPEECKLCGFKYSHKYSIQDHIFTKKHIDNVKVHIDNLKKFAEGEGGGVSERPSTSDFATPTTMAQLLQEQEQLERSHNEAAAAAAALAVGQPHLAQLHMMQMAAAGLPVPVSLSSGNSVLNSIKDTSVLNRKGELKDAKGSTTTTKDGSSAGGGKVATQSTHAAPLVLNPFGDIPGVMGSDTSGLLPYMYGFPGYYPAGTFLHPAMYAGSPDNFLFDPTTQGTPLALLPLPADAMADVIRQSGEPGACVARYAQEGSAAAAAAAAVGECLEAEVDVEVGFMCKKCQLVFASETLCHGHQRTVCFAGLSTNTTPKGDARTVTIVQVMYECRPCQQRHPTPRDFQEHCETDAHRARVGGGGTSDGDRVSDDVPSPLQGVHAQDAWTKSGNKQQQPFS